MSSNNLRGMKIKLIKIITSIEKWKLYLEINNTSFSIRKIENLFYMKSFGFIWNGVVWIKWNCLLYYEDRIENNFLSLTKKEKNGIQKSQSYEFIS